MPAAAAIAALSIGTTCAFGWVLASAADVVEARSLLIGASAILAIAACAGLTLRDPRAGVVIFVVASALSPRLPGDLRLSDACIPGFALAWMASSARGAPYRLRSPIAVPIALVCAAMVVTTLLGVSMGTVPSPLFGWLVVAKRVEYFLLFLFAMNVARTPESARSIVTAFLVGAVAVSVIGLLTASFDRVIAVDRAGGFDGRGYNALAGYLVLAASVAIARTLQAGRTRTRALSAGAACLIVTCALFSYSREGYFVLAVAVVILGLLRYRVLLPVLAVLVLAAPIVLPRSVVELSQDAVAKVRTCRTSTVGGNSLTARLAGWQYRWYGWGVKRPVLGSGVGSIPFSVDSEYMLRLVEGGAVGLGAFLLVLGACGRALMRCRRSLRGTSDEYLAVAMLAAFCALLLMGFVSAAWSTIRIMEPFWVLLGVVVARAASATDPAEAEEHV